MGLFDDMHEMFRSADKAREEREDEFRKLCAEPCLRVPEIGDRVLVAAGLLGMGYLWIRREAEVVSKGDTAYRIRFVNCESYHEGNEHWVHQALITDVLTAANPVL